MLASAGTASSHREGPSGSKKKSAAASAAEPSEPPIQVQLSAQVHALCASLPSLNLMPLPLPKGAEVWVGVRVWVWVEIWPGTTLQAVMSSNSSAVAFGVIWCCKVCM